MPYNAVRAFQWVVGGVESDFSVQFGQSCTKILGSQIYLQNMATFLSFIHQFARFLLRVILLYKFLEMLLHRNIVILYSHYFLQFSQLITYFKKASNPLSNQTFRFSPVFVKLQSKVQTPVFRLGFDFVFPLSQ